MKRLILTRHQKSSWDNLHATDHERTLNDRGREGCKLIAAWLLDFKYIPDQAFVSTAERCVETWDRMSAAMNCDAPITYETDLYHAPPQTILKTLRTATGDTVFLTAHNPGIGEFAYKICASAPDHPRFFGYPSGATTIVEFDVENWNDIDFKTGKFHKFIIPSELR